MKYHLRPIRMASFKKQNKRWWGSGETGMLVHCWRDCKMEQLLWKTLHRFLKEWKVELPCDPEIPLLGLYPKELKTGSWRDICTPMFISSTIQNSQEVEPIQTSINRWVDKQNVVHTMEYYSALKRKDMLIHATTWINLDDIMLIEIGIVK